MRYEIRAAGFGGQGIITLGYVLAKAAVIHDRKYASMTQSYGPEARGGACRADVIVSNEPIDYPKLSQFECFVAMSNDAYKQFHGGVGDGGIVILEGELVQPEQSEMIENATYYYVSSLKEAEELGNKLVANMVMLGFVQSITGVVSEKAVEEAVLERFPRYAELNLRAVRKGMQLGKLAKA